MPPTAATSSYTPYSAHAFIEVGGVGAQRNTCLPTAHTPLHPVCPSGQREQRRMPRIKDMVLVGQRCDEDSTFRLYCSRRSVGYGLMLCHAQLIKKTQSLARTRVLGPCVSSFPERILVLQVAYRAYDGPRLTSNIKILSRKSQKIQKCEKKNQFCIVNYSTNLIFFGFFGFLGLPKSQKCQKKSILCCKLQH